MLPFLDKKKIAQSIVSKRVKDKIVDEEDENKEVVHRQPDDVPAKPKYNSLARKVQKALTERKKAQEH